MKLGNKKEKKNKEVIKVEPPTLEEIDAKIDELNELLEKNLDFWKTFKVSIVRGFGTALGATVLIAAALYVLDKFLNSVDEIPILTPILELIQAWLQGNGAI